ncbi:trichohyalin-like [Sitodiplosis mosellana]|uniref:trichohyalin-like n=1 Tax=Sitodiplosis mosellana TaxID=263140 RepID=UPI002443ACC9|nr:trichohyalin-like [Sitodiplosis mosellana]
MKSNSSKSKYLFDADAPRQPTHQQVMEMVKAAEREMQIDLHEKRNRLHIQTANETLGYQQEIHNKYNMLREQEVRTQIENLDRLKIQRELDRQKFVEHKQIQQHVRNSEAFRLELSKKLLEECEQSRNEQIQRLKLEQESAEAEENAQIQEARRIQIEEMQKEAEAENVIKQQTNWQSRIELQKELERKIEKRKRKEAEKEIERKSLERTDEAVKRREEELKMVKQQEIQSQKEFLKRQIEERKKNEEYHRQREIEYGKIVAEENRQQMEKEAAEAEYARRKQNVENLNFADYLSRTRADKKEIEAEKIDLRHVSLINEEFEADAEMKRHERKQLLNTELRNEYFKKLKEKQTEKIKEKQKDVRSLEESQRLNAEYEKMMAARKAQNKLQFQQDLQRQIEFKNMEAAYKLEQDAKHRQGIEEMARASNTLDQKILNEGIENVLTKHPFYKCLLHKN